MTKAFREAGIVADHASDGESGLFMGCENAYDVMVIDRMLPRRVGFPSSASCVAAASRRRF